MACWIDKSALDLLKENTGAKLAEQMAVQEQVNKAAAERDVYKEESDKQEGVKNRNQRKEEINLDAKIKSSNLKLLLAGKGGKEKDLKIDTQLIADLEDAIGFEKDLRQTGKGKMTDKEFKEKIDLKSKLYKALRQKYSEVE